MRVSSLKSFPKVIFVIALGLVLISCSSGPPPIEKGTPPFYWQAANETYKAGDFIKTSEHLSHLVRSQNEFTARAQPWMLILSSGVAKGFMDLADSFENGARANKTNPAAFRKLMNDMRTLANQTVLQFAEVFENFQKTNTAEKLPLAFPFPSGSAAPVPQLAKAGAGMMLQETEIADARRRAIARAVILRTCEAAGAPEDVAKTQELFKQGTAEVARPVFLLAMANVLYDQSQLYIPRKMDQPDRMKILLERAAEALKPLPDSKEKKELDKKIQAALKGIKSR